MSYANCRWVEFPWRWQERKKQWQDKKQASQGFFRWKTKHQKAQIGWLLRSVSRKSIGRFAKTGRFTLKFKSLIGNCDRQAKDQTSDRRNQEPELPRRRAEFKRCAATNWSQENCVLIAESTSIVHPRRLVKRHSCHREVTWHKRENCWRNTSSHTRRDTKNANSVLRSFHTLHTVVLEDQMMGKHTFQWFSLQFQPRGANMRLDKWENSRDAAAWRFQKVRHQIQSHSALDNILNAKTPSLKTFKTRYHAQKQSSSISTGLPRVTARVRPKQTEVSWDGIRDHSSLRLQQYRHLDHCTEFLEQRRHLRKVPLQQKGWKTLTYGNKVVGRGILRTGWKTLS